MTELTVSITDCDLQGKKVACVKEFGCITMVFDDLLTREKIEKVRLYFIKKYGFDVATGLKKIGELDV